MKHILTVGVSILLIGNLFALPKISNVSAKISGGYSSGTLKISYTISDSSKQSIDSDSRYVQVKIFESKSEANAWCDEIKQNYPESEAPSCSYDEFMFSRYSESEVSNGSHTFSVDMIDRFGLSAREFKSEYPSVYLAAAVFDDSQNASSCQIVAITYEVGSISDDVKKLYAKSRTLTGICTDDDGGYYGVVALKLSKVNAKTGAVKASATITPFSSSKKLTATTSIVADEEGCLYGELKFKTPIGEMSLEVVGELYCITDGSGRCASEFYFCGGSEYGYEIYSADVGGKIDADELYFTVDMDEEPYLGDEWESITYPEDVYVKVSNGTRFTTPKASTLKYKRYSEYGDVWYELEGLDSSNPCGLKLTYTASTGMFKGSYSLYFSNECCVEEGVRPTLKKISVSVSGVFIEGEGVGVATAKFGSDNYSWVVSLCPADY